LTLYGYCATIVPKEQAIMASRTVSYNPEASSTPPGSKRFQQARRNADAELRLARRTGQSADLLCFEEVRDMLKARAAGERVHRKVPIDAIVGSVGRCSDYTRSFRPLKDSARQRWTGIQAAFAAFKPLPPIEVVQLGETYFVSDGHHRVSVAREQGMTSIEASVVLIEARVPLPPDIQPDELALQAEYASFLESTRLDEIRPEADLRVTVLDQYEALQIEIADLLESIQAQRPAATLPDVAGQWYDEVYLPMAHVVRQHQLVQEFDGRTETDLVLWLREYRSNLEEALGWEIEPELAAADLARQHRTARRAVANAAGRVSELLGLGGLQAGPSPGAWRKGRGLSQQDACLFGRILVPLTGADEDWPAVAQAAEIACRESAQLLGLHVIPAGASREPAQLETVRNQFLRHCRVAGVSGTIAVDEGHIARRICERSQWADLIVLRPNHAPPEATAAKVGCGLHTLIRRCPTPLLVVPGAFSALERPLLAYDGSPKAQEALFVAASLAEQGQLPLTVITITEDHLGSSQLLSGAAAYLESWSVEATLVQQEGPVADALLQAADAHGSDLILMGGYGHSPIVELVSGSVVDKVLRSSKQPVLLCR
jgi:nucleotide-binding universal stress UspA family protein